MHVTGAHRNVYVSCPVWRAYWLAESLSCVFKRALIRANGNYYVEKRENIVVFFNLKRVKYCHEKLKCRQSYCSVFLLELLPSFLDVSAT